jgi:hypothetical protein
VGVFDLSLAHPLGTACSEISKHLLPLACAVAELPRVHLQEPEIAHIRQGKRIAWPASFAPNDLPAQVRELAAFDPNNNLAAVVGIDSRQKIIFPLKVLPNSHLPGYT